ncbi:MAG: SCP2 sterol-binding domain-containing protein [Gammaproteobacteria bacterium]|nr:SCP2 sterol-binding domain-containing protein [Gammaproteobacteria bacterium]
MQQFIALALNKVLSTDNESFNRLKQLDQKRLKFTLEPIGFVCYFKLTNAGFEMCEQGEPDIAIAGKPSNFIKLAQQPKISLYQSGIKVVGDMALAEEIKNIFSRLDLDWEALIAEYTGDVAARQINRAGRAGFKWLQTTGKDLQSDVVEYLQEEIRILPTRVEMEHFAHDNQELRHAVDRLSARLQV